MKIFEIFKLGRSHIGLLPQGSEVYDYPFDLPPKSMSEDRDNLNDDFINAIIKYEND